MHVHWISSIYCGISGIISHNNVVMHTFGVAGSSPGLAGGCTTLHTTKLTVIF